jgi:hypothetical protein
MFRIGVHIPMPNDAALARMTAKVRDLTPNFDAPAHSGEHAGRVTDPAAEWAISPIRKMFLRHPRGRTYDQVLGDLPNANGDPSLTLFGENVTPNAHALSTAFATFDNFYVDAEVSYDGHAFSTGAYAPDFVEKMWPANYGRREGLYLSEGGYKMRNPVGNIAAPPQGYLWDFAKRANISYRSYGEFAAWDRAGEQMVAFPRGADGHIHPTFPPFDMAITDVKRIRSCGGIQDVGRRAGAAPVDVRLPRDHTSRTSPGAITRNGG